MSDELDAVAKRLAALAYSPNETVLVQAAHLRAILAERDDLHHINGRLRASHPIRPGTIPTEREELAAIKAVWDRLDDQDRRIRQGESSGTINELHEKLAAAQAESQVLRTSVSTMETEQVILRRDIRALRAQRSSDTEATERMRGALQAVREERDDLRGKLGMHERQVADDQATIAKLRKELADEQELRAALQGDGASAARENEALHGDVRELREKLARVEDDRDVIQAELDTVREHRNALLDAPDQARADLEEQIGQAQAETDRLREALRAEVDRRHTQERRALENSQALAREIEGLNNENRALRSKIDSGDLSDVIDQMQQVVIRQVQLTQGVGHGAMRAVTIRRRQLAKYTLEHDIQHGAHTLENAAKALLDQALDCWPWRKDEQYRNLLKSPERVLHAAALLMAAYDVAQATA